MPKVQFTYKTGRQRMLRVGDAKLLQKLGQGTYLTRDMRAQSVPIVTVETQVDLASLRTTYQEVVGKRPFNGWGADTLLEKIAEASK